MRVFLAIDIPDKIKKEIERQIEPLKKEYPQFTWIPQENFHITVHFIGEVKDEKKLVERLKTQLFDKEQFYLYGGEVELFMHNKIILYIRFFKERKLWNIQKEIGDGKKYVAHMSFGRCKIPSKQQYFVLKKRLEKMSVDISFLVKELVLFESIPNGGQFPVYKKLAKISLITA